jgi:CRISPR system Cascade subunit CasD
MHRHLVLRLEAPLFSLGGEAIDNLGVIRPFPAKSMITGLLANAAGVERYECEVLQALQDNLVIGSRIVQSARLLRDFQTAELSKSDQGWTTREMVEGRGGGTASYLGPHLRYRDYWADAEVTAVFRVLPASPFTLNQLENALLRPARPLFLGRKTCIPSGPVFNGDVYGPTVFSALMALSAVGLGKEDLSLQWPAFDGSGDDAHAQLSRFPESRMEPICDERNWITGVHCGERLVRVLDLNQPTWGKGRLQ